MAHRTAAKTRHRSLPWPHALAQGCEGRADQVGAAVRRLLAQGLAEIASIADEIDLAAGTELTHEGASGREFIVIVDGTATVDDHEGNAVTVGPGDFVGEISLVIGSPQTRTVVATSPVRAPWSSSGGRSRH